MFLVDPVEIQSAIGMVATGQNQSMNVDQLKASLLLAQPAVVSTMNVETLERKSCVDTFDVAIGTDHPLEFRLTNGLLVQDSVSVTSPSGVVDASVIEVDHKLGVVRVLSGNSSGDYTIAYDSGLEEQESGVAKDVPLELQAAITTAMMLWFRSNILTPKLPGIRGITPDMLIAPLRRDISRNVYGWYQRPRIGVQWPRHYKGT